MDGFSGMIVENSIPRCAFDNISAMNAVDEGDSSTVFPFVVQEAMAVVAESLSLAPEKT